MKITTIRNIFLLKHILKQKENFKKLFCRNNFFIAIYDFSI